MHEQERQKKLAEFNRLKETFTRTQAQVKDAPEWAREDGVENLSEFFNGTAHLWDAKFGDNYTDLHVETAAQLPATDEAIAILDVGCGTGLAFEHIFKRAPNAKLTGLDQAPRMLDEIRRKYGDRLGQIELVESSCLEWPAALAGFDFAVSNLTTHHFAPDIKKGVYRDIRSALKDGGVYIEGDQAVSPEMEADGLRLFNEWIAKLPDGERGAWNYDVTLATDTNMRLMREAGFTECEVRWQDFYEEGIGHAVIVAR